MKKLLSLAILIAAPLFILSCQSDTEDKVIDKPFKPVSVTLSTVMDMEANPQTKADQYPTDTYTLDYIYLMVNTSPDTYTSHKIDLVTEDGQKGFNLRISSISPTEINLTTNGALLAVVAPGQDIFFSSHPTCEVATEVDPVYTTPNGGDLYAPFGKDLYKSAHAKINLIDNGFEISGKEYLVNQDNSFELLMYRLTGSFKAKVIFFRQATPQDETPLSVTPSDWTSVGLSPHDQWTVTPYLRNYYNQFLICDGLRGTTIGEPTATYMLSQGGKALETQEVRVNKLFVGDFILNTLVAGTSESYFPYLFHGLLMNSTISFYIKNEATGDELITEHAIADVYLGQEIMANDFKTLNLCINITELHNQTLKSGVIDSKNVFFFWE